MGRRAVEVALLFAMAACANSTSTPMRDRPPVETAPDATPVRQASASASATAVAPATPSVAPDTTAAAPSVPPRPATIPLAAHSGDPRDADLAAGDDALERGDLAAALKSYQAAKQQPGQATAATVGIARVTIARLGVPLDFAAAKGRAPVAEVANELSRVTKGSPAFGPAFVELGRVRLLLGDAQGAIDSLRKGVELLPNEPEAHSQLGIAWLATGHADEAVRELRYAADLDPGSSARRGNLGTALMMAGQTKEAIAQYEQRAQMDDGDARAHSDLGTALLATDDIQRALAELERAVALDPNRASFHSNLGYALQQAGRLDRAVAEYREAIQRDPKLASAWINLSTALARNPSTRRDARAALERARELSPDDPRVKANFEELDSLEKGHPPSASGDAGPGLKFPASP